MDFTTNDVSAVLLGTMQDGGLPHIGCQCARCKAAFQDPEKMEFAACLAIVDTRQKEAKVWLVDATPDIKWQMQILASSLGVHPEQKDRTNQPAGIFLTHAHMGHIGGLPQLGPEAMAVQRLPVYATVSLVDLLKSTRLWTPAISGLDLNPLSPEQTLTLTPELSITAIPVPHRDEWGVGTVAYKIKGPRKSLLYVPDIDSWEEWPEARVNLASVDYALVDASFYSPAELDGREPVAHPFVTDTLQRFATIPGQLILTHFNHTNPVLDKNSAQRKQVQQAGAIIGKREMRMQL